MNIVTEINNIFKESLNKYKTLKNLLKKITF